MISNTRISLYQFARWLGLNGYDVAGIERANCARCCCHLQYTWQKPSHWSRQCLEDALSKAEDIIEALGAFYLSTVQIEDEQHNVDTIFNSEDNFVSYRPRRPLGDLKFGLYELNSVQTVTLDWSALVAGNGNEIPSSVELTFSHTSAQELSKSDFRVYISEATLPDRETSINSHYGELRPYKSFELTELYDALTETYTYNGVIEIDTFLFNSPDNYEDDECCENNVATNSYCYLSEVEVFVRELSSCNATYISENAPCPSYDCAHQETEVCTYLRRVYDEDWFVPQLYNCSTGAKVNLRYAPDRVSFNYLSGHEPNENKYVRRDLANIVFMMALGLADCVKDGCQCEVCMSSKIEYYQGADSYQVRVASDTNGEYDTVRQILTDKFDTDYAKGLMQSRGVLTALALLRKEKLNPVGLARL